MQVIRYSVTMTLSPFENAVQNCEIVKWGYHVSNEIQTRFRVIQVCHDTAFWTWSIDWRDQLNLHHVSSTEVSSREVHTS
jgi:hypothetical protein